MKKVFVIGMAAVMMGALVNAAEMTPVTMEMKGHYPGATHVIEAVAGNGMADLITNGAYTAYYQVPAGSTVRLVGYECRAPFLGVYSTNQSVYDVTCSFGTSNSATALMAAQQCGTNSTIWWKPGVPILTATPSLTVSRITVTNVVGEATNIYQMVTNVAATVSATAADGTTYATDTDLMLTLQPNAAQSLAWATQGKVRVFLDVRKPYGR